MRILLSGLFLLNLVVVSAQAANYPQSGCKVYIDLRYGKYQGNLANKLVSQGFDLVAESNGADFFAMNWRSPESEDAYTVAELKRSDNFSVVQVFGYDTVQFLLSRRHLANRLTSKLIDVIPTCEEAKTMAHVEYEIKQ